MMAPITPMVKHLIIINIIFFVGSNFVVPSDVAYRFFSLYFPLTDNFYFWQIFTHMFMHAKISISFFHITFSLLALYMFGSTLEHFWGGKKFLFYYISCGLGAVFMFYGIQYFEISLILNQLNGAITIDELNILSKLNLNNISNSNDFNNILIENKIINSPKNDEVLTKISNIYLKMDNILYGSNYALYGLIVAYAFLFPDSMMYIFFIVPVKAKYFLPVIIGIDIVLSFLGNSFFGGGSLVSFAYIGSILTGILILYNWNEKKQIY